MDNPIKTPVKVKKDGGGLRAGILSPARCLSLQESRDVIMQTLHSNLNLFGSLTRIQRRKLIEYYCNMASFLPVYERMLFQLYYRDGYTTVEISQLLIVSAGTVSRRLKRIAEKLTEICQGTSKNDGLGRLAGSISENEPAFVFEDNGVL